MAPQLGKRFKVSLVSHIILQHGNLSGPGSIQKTNHTSMLVPSADSVHVLSDSCIQAAPVCRVTCCFRFPSAFFKVPKPVFWWSLTPLTPPSVQSRAVRGAEDRGFMVFSPEEHLIGGQRVTFSYRTKRWFPVMQPTQAHSLTGLLSSNRIPLCIILPLHAYSYLLGQCNLLFCTKHTVFILSWCNKKQTELVYFQS